MAYIIINIITITTVLAYIIWCIEAKVRHIGPYARRLN